MTDARPDVSTLTPKEAFAELRLCLAHIRATLVEANAVIDLLLEERAKYLGTGRPEDPGE
jgi:hypothetical protein